MAIFTGSGVALVTPFDKNMEIDWEVFKDLIQFHLENETDALIICGTTGEAATLSDEEQGSLIQMAVKTVKGKIPIIGGAASNSTAHAVKLATMIEKVGADGVLAVNPYYNKGSQEGIYMHFKHIAAATKLPIILYNVPGRTASNILPETVLRLSAIKNIVGMKEASGDLSQVAHLAQLVRGRIDIYSGNDDQILPVLSLGGIGVISVLANILPKETHDMVHLYLQGETAKATALQLETLPLIHAIFTEVNPIPVKEALIKMNFPVNHGRLPLTAMDESKRAHLFEEMKAFNL